MVHKWNDEVAGSSAAGSVTDVVVIRSRRTARAGTSVPSRTKTASGRTNRCAGRRPDMRIPREVPATGERSLRYGRAGVEVGSAPLRRVIGPESPDLHA